MDIKQSPTGVKKTHNSNFGKNKGKELIKREKIEGTPFMAIWTKEQKWFGVLGKYRVTGRFEKKDELIQHLEYKPWELLIAVMNVMAVESDTIKGLYEEVKNVATK